MAKFNNGVFVPYNEMTDEQKKEFHRLGGIGAKKKQKERKMLGEYLRALLESETKTGNVAEDMCWALVQKALRGNIEAFKTIEESIGEKQAQKIQAEVDNKIIKVTLEEDKEE